MKPEESQNPIHLAELQRVQRIFDVTHGFSFSEKGKISATAFSALALSGEVGELANQIKKAQRADWTGEDAKIYLDKARAEIGGIFAYLLKISDILDVDLGEAYLHTLSDNWLRFPPHSKPGKKKTICIAGPSGSGKSSLINYIADDSSKIYLEEPTNNPYFTGMYGDSPTFDAFASQQWFLDAMKSFFTASLSERKIIIDQDPAAIVRVYGRALKNQGKISNKNYIQLLLNLVELEELINSSRNQRFTVFLDADTEILSERMKQRGDPSLPSSKWLAQIRNYFLELHASSPNSILINTSKQSISDLADRIRENF